jgi:nicotinate dehydrogenase subunit B
MTAMLSRRAVLGGGALIVAFSLTAHSLTALAQPVAEKVKLPGSLADTPMLDAWIRVDAQGVTVFTGKAELGQGAATALLQLAAEELGMDMAAIDLITADTALTPNEGYTAGSHTIQDSGTAIMHAAAQARGILIGLAAAKLGVPAGQLHAADGAVVAPDGSKLAFADLLAGDALHHPADAVSPLKDPKDYALVGTSVPRVDIPAKVTGGQAFLQDMRLPDMAHARVVLPPVYGATLRALDDTRVRALPGVLQVVRDGSFLAVIAEGEWQAIAAMRALGEAAVWDAGPALSPQAGFPAALKTMPAQDIAVLERHDAAAAPVKRFAASYQRPFLSHGSIGPSCAVGLLQDGQLTVWSHAQGMFPLRAAIAGLMRMKPETVRCIHVPGSGCYGHNGADDVAGQVALLAKALPGRPVRLQWMREQEHGWEPFGSAMLTSVQAGLDSDGKIVDWRYEIWTNPHATRPGGPGSLLAGWMIAQPIALPKPVELPMPEGGGDRNSVPIYALPNVSVVDHFVTEMPIRVSALRGLGAAVNVFSIESAMDELAHLAGADAVEFRLRHLADVRAREVVSLAADKFGWAKRKKGSGFAFARYKNLGAYCAMAVEVDVQHDTGAVRVVRAVLAVDSGQAVSPDGIRNQIEGGFLQSMSWALFEAVTWESGRITSRDWAGYPILRYGMVPDSVETHVINRPGAPFLGTGEAAQGPTPAAIANAIFDATGVRMREMPFSAKRMKAVLGV